MKISNILMTGMLVGFTLFSAGCVNVTPFDYSAYKRSNPRSILVLPPLNNSPDVKASHSLLSVTTSPLAESGYYVFPVAVVDETFKQNGLSNAADIHSVSPKKLHEIYGADSALYLTVTKYGASYQLLASETRVTAEAKLVDLKSGEELWHGTATASTAEQRNNNQGGGLVGLLVMAAIEQIASELTDQSHTIADITSDRLLLAGSQNGMLYGPRSPKFGKEELQK